MTNDENNICPYNVTFKSCFSLSCSSSTGAGRRRRNYSPLPWSDFFDKCEDVLTPGNNVSLSVWGFACFA